jgi:hypothetical protein
MTGMGRKLSTVAGLTAALVLWIAPQAGAAVTTTDITTPTDTTYTLYNDDAPNTIAISGTSDGTTGDQVDIYCYYGSLPFRSQLAINVAVQADHSFSTTASLVSVEAQVCRLRAVPAGTTPGNLDPFNGPLLAGGERLSSVINVGPNDGAIYDFYVWGQQLTAASYHDSYSGCSLCNSYLLDSNLDQTTSTFYGNDSFDRQNLASTRSEVQVDAANSYGSDQARFINSDAGNFPGLTWDVTQDPSNGNLTITDSEPLVKCPDATYPPDSTTCPNFVNTGVRVDRTLTQEQDGHLIFIKDRYVSTDGHDHPLDLLPYNDQAFHDLLDSTTGTEIAYKFPGESSFSTHATDQSVSFPDSIPAAIYINVEGSLDGATDTGQGAIVFDRPSSPAQFGSVGSTSELEFHQTGLATPSCSPSFSFAYAQDYDSSNVQTLAQMALDRFNASPATTCSPTANPTPAGPTGERARALKKCKKKHSKKARRKCRKRAKKLPV